MESSLAAATLVLGRQRGRTAAGQCQGQRQLGGTWVHPTLFYYYTKQAPLPESLLRQMMLGRERMGNRHCVTTLKYFPRLGKKLFPSQKV